MQKDLNRYKIFVSIETNPSMEALILSPEDKGPTPAGVPVNIMSPGSKVKILDI